MQPLDPPVGDAVTTTMLLQKQAHQLGWSIAASVSTLRGIGAIRNRPARAGIAARKVCRAGCRRTGGAGAVTRALQIRLFSLRGILGVSLLLLALVPAVLVAWLMAGASARAVQDMAGSLLTHVAERVQLGTEDHLQQP